MDYRFREIRKGECTRVLDFAKGHGSTTEPGALRHHLSLMAQADGELVATALCLETQPAQFVLEITHTDGADGVLITELVNRCLRKLQSENITSARVNSPSEAAIKNLWTATNWLDHIEETPPPDLDAALADSTSLSAA